MDLNSVLISTGMAVIVALLVRLLPISTRFTSNDVRTRVRDLESQLTALEHQNERLSDDYNQKLIDFTNAFVEWSAREKAYEAQIERLEAEVRRLRHRIRELEALAGMDSEPASVLGIWPDAEISHGKEADALFNSGWSYRSLVGDEATRASVIRELQRHEDIRIVEIGAHGEEAGLHLHGGLTEPGWWARVLGGRDLQLVVLMACESDAVSDALIRAGVPAVVSVQRSVDDVEAVTFVQELYANLADGRSLSQSVESAKLFVSRETWEMVRLRER